MLISRIHRGSVTLSACSAEFHIGDYQLVGGAYTTYLAGSEPFQPDLDRFNWSYHLHRILSATYSPHCGVYFSLLRVLRFKSKRLYDDDLHQQASSLPPQSPLVSLVSCVTSSGACSPTNCVCGIPLLTRFYGRESRCGLSSSSFRPAPTISAPKGACFVKPPWDFDEIWYLSDPIYYRLGLVCSGDLNQLPSDVPHLLPSLSISLEFSKPSASPIKLSLLIGSRIKIRWTWPSHFAATYSIRPSVLRIREIIVTSNFVGCVCVAILEISDGFIGVYIVRLLLYLSCMKNFSVDSPWLLPASFSSSTKKRILQPCLFSMKRDVFSDMVPSYCFSLLTILLSCVAVFTGPEDAIKNASVFFVGESWLSTSHYVTILRLFDFVEKASLTHLSLGLCSLSSSSHEELSKLALYVVVLYVFFKEDEKFLLMLYPNKIV